MINPSVVHLRIHSYQTMVMAMVTPRTRLLILWKPELLHLTNLLNWVLVVAIPLEEFGEHHQGGRVRVHHLRALFQ